MYTKGKGYDATRHYWRLNGNRAQLATHVIGVVNGLAEIGKILNVDLKDLITDKEERETKVFVKPDEQS